MADENFRELEQEEAATGVVDAGDFEDNAGTGAIAEEQETARAADAQSTESEDASPIVGGGEQNIPPMPSEPVEEAQPVDLHEDQGSGLDIAVIIVVLLIIIAGLSYAIWSANNAPAQQTVAQQQAVQQTNAEAKEPPFEVGELPEGVAAVVNGEEIPESKVTDYIAEFRELYGLTSDSDWSQWMASLGYTPETVRYEAVQMFVNEALVRQAIADLGIEVTDEDVNEIYDGMRAEYASDEEWQQALEDAGLTDEAFREQCEQQAESNALMERIGSETVTSEQIDADTLDYIKTYYTEYADVASLDEVDSEIADSVREMIRFYANQQAYSDFMTAQRAESDIVMSDTPADLPYNENSLQYLFDSLALQFQMQQMQQQSAQQSAQ